MDQFSRIASDRRPERPAQPATNGRTQKPPSELDQVITWARRYGRSVVFGLVAAVVGTVIGWGYRLRREVRAEQMSERLWRARTLEDVEAVIEEGPADLAAVALLRAAKRYYDTQRYDLAMRKWGEFQVRFPRHLLAPAAELGKLHCLEARGQLHEALEGFAGFVRAQTNHFLTPVAWLAEARCLAELGRVEEARARCEEFLVAHPENPWKEHAEQLLKNLPRLASAQVFPSAPLPAAGPPAAPSPAASDSNTEFRLELPGEVVSP